MSRRAHFALTIIFLALLHQTIAINILVIVSLPLRSHYMAFQELFRELANRGHNVTVINNFPDKNATPRLEFIDLEYVAPGAGFTPTLEYYESLGSWYIHLYNIYKHLTISPNKTTEDCEQLFTNKNVKKHFARGVKYDVIFVEQFVSDCGLAYAAAVYDAPIIGITSHVLMPKHYPRLGIPYDISKNPHYFSNAGSNPTLWQKVEIAITDFLFLTLDKWTREPKVNAVFAKYLPNNPVDLEKVSSEKMKMIFVYQHHSITGGRLLTPQLLEIAGIHIKKPKALSSDLEEFISSAEHGVIFVSFGSMLQANTMTSHKRQQFLDAFKRIPQKVIWKWDNASLPEGNDNVLTGSWLPQLDILCHPKVVGFISHGGMLSMSEAAHCGTPLVTVPFFGDQFSNAAAARESGLGLTLFFTEINADNLVKAIMELTSERMQLNARSVSRHWHDRPQPVMDSAIYWTEYVARHRDSPPLLPTQQTKWFQTSLLDVLCLILGTIIVVIFIIYAILQFLIKLVCRLLCKTKTKDE